jgi:hypothetical protein
MREKRQKRVNEGGEEVGDGAAQKERERESVFLGKKETGCMKGVDILI